MHNYGSSLPRVTVSNNPTVPLRMPCRGTVDIRDLRADDLVLGGGRYHLSHKVSMVDKAGNLSNLN